MNTTQTVGGNDLEMKCESIACNAMDALRNSLSDRRLCDGKCGKTMSKTTT
jgi:hypothetical protein